MPFVERKSLVSSASAFSFVSTTTSEAGLNGRIAFIKDEPIEPAPPTTRTDLPAIFSVSASLLFSISVRNMLVSRFVTCLAMNSSKLNI